MKTYPRINKSKVSRSSDATELAIRRLVQSVGTGDRLPSIRDIRRRFDVGQAVVERVLNQLKDEGLIYVKPKSGSYRSDPVALPINIVYRHSKADLHSHGFYQEFMSGLILALAEIGHTVRLHAASTREGLIDVLGLLRNTPTRLVTFGSSWADVDLTQSYRRSDVTTVHVLPNFVEQVPGSVVLDDRSIIHQQLDHLVDLGHTNIAYLHRYTDKTWIRAEHNRWGAFHAYVVEKGLSLNPRFLRFIGLDNELLGGAIDEIMGSERPPTGIVLSADNQVAEAYIGLRRNGVEPGRDVAVVSVNDASWAEFISPKLSSVRISAQTGAQAVKTILERLGAGEAPGIETIQPELMVRESSVGCPPPAR